MNSNIDKEEKRVKAPVLDHIRLTSHVTNLPTNVPKIQWAAKDAKARGPIIGTISDKLNRNCIGSHRGSYTVYRALSIASGKFSPLHRPDLKNT